MSILSYNGVDYRLTTVDDKIREISKSVGARSEVSTSSGTLDTVNKKLDYLIQHVAPGQSVGNAAPEDVLEGKTFSNSLQSGLTGTLPNAGSITKMSYVYTTEPDYEETLEINGKVDTLTVLGAYDANLVPENIVKDVSIFGVTGIAEATGSQAKIKSSYQVAIGEGTVAKRTMLITLSKGDIVVFNLYTPGAAAHHLMYSNDTVQDNEVYQYNNADYGCSYTFVAEESSTHRFVITSDYTATSLETWGYVVIGV